MISAVVNTAASQTGTIRGYRYRDRKKPLFEIILPRLKQSVDELIVVGHLDEEPPHADVFIRSPSEYSNSGDAVVQRQIGVDESSGDLLYFQHDDHVPDIGFFTELRRLAASAPPLAVFSGIRREVGEDGSDNLHAVNDGDPDWIMGHFCAMTRAACEEVPWGELPKRNGWDLSHTERCKDHGVKRIHSTDLVCYDLERGQCPSRILSAIS